MNWVLVTSGPVTSVEEALAALENYSQRWGVEECHKALKTGCHVEERGDQSSERLERVTGLLAVIAVRLLQIRELAREQPDLPAVAVAPKEWVETLAAIRKRHAVGMTIQQFVRCLGGLGGHLGRKGDGEPGWITLWRGVEKLLMILRGTTLARKSSG